MVSYSLALSKMNQLLDLTSDLIETAYAEVDILFKMLILTLGLLLVNCLLLGLTFLVLYATLVLLGKLSPCNVDKSRVCVGFFHPYSQAGGGGERVLWHAVKAIQNRYPNVDCVIYTGDSDYNHKELNEHLKDRFNMTLSRPVAFIHLSGRKLLEAWLYPRFTMLLQALGSVIVGIEAVVKYRPDVFIDTMGYSFCYPLVKIITGSSVACYIHYPIISTDMINVVQQQTEAHNNQGAVASSPILSYFKSLYYQVFSKAYGFVGQRADVVTVNSTWTRGHIDSIWGVKETTSLVFPPCDVAKFSSLLISPYEEKLVKKILSVGQFRPEKDHALQLRSFKQLLELLSARGGDIDPLEVQLVIVGGARNVEDDRRVRELQNLAKELNIECQVEFKVNLPFESLLQVMQDSCIGLHTMWNEHFGIGVVEMQAAGLITIAHDSGGPKLDIIVPQDDNLTGLLASDVETYSEAMYSALTMKDEDRDKMIIAARESVLRFSDSNFEKKFTTAVDSIIQKAAQLNSST